MRKFCIAYLMMALCLVVRGGETNCQEVGGGVVTNFLQESGTINGKTFNSASLGTAAGDLRGGVGIYVLSSEPGPNGTTVLHVQHHWVTEAGDTIVVDPAVLTLFPTHISGLFAAKYIDGVNITGGTGRFDGASGNLKVFGGVDFNQGQICLRYQGKICFAQPER